VVYQHEQALYTNMAPLVVLTVWRCGACRTQKRRGVSEMCGTEDVATGSGEVK
jgi:hypothetical protein